MLKKTFITFSLLLCLILGGIASIKPVFAMDNTVTVTPNDGPETTETPTQHPNYGFASDKNIVYVSIAVLSVIIVIVVIDETLSKKKSKL